MFTMPADAVRTLAAPGEQGWFVVKVDEVKKGDLSTAPAMVESTRAQFNQFAGEEYAAQFARAVAAEVGLECNDKAIEQLRQELAGGARSEEHTSELQSLMRISYAVFCLKKKKSQMQNRN